SSRCAAIARMSSAEESIGQKSISAECEPWQITSRFWITAPLMVLLLPSIVTQEQNVSPLARPRRNFSSHLRYLPGRPDRSAPQREKGSRPNDSLRPDTAASS